MSDEDPKVTNTREKAEPGEATPATGEGKGSGAADPAELIERLEAENRELADGMLGPAAQLENWKRGAKEERHEASSRRLDQLSKELLPALDHLARALQHAPPGDPLAVGVQQTEKQLLQALDKFGIQRFSAVGKPFDPAIHDAIQQVETTEFP